MLFVLAGGWEAKGELSLRLYQYQIGPGESIQPQSDSPPFLKKGFHSNSDMAPTPRRQVVRALYRHLNPKVCTSSDLTGRIRWPFFPQHMSPS